MDNDKLYESLKEQFLEEGLIRSANSYPESSKYNYYEDENVKSNDGNKYSLILDEDLKKHLSNTSTLEEPEQTKDYVPRLDKNSKRHQ